MFGSKDLLFSSETYGVAKSLRFRRSASAQLTRTPGSAGNRKTWTWSGWVKRGLLATGQGVFCAVGAATDTGSFYLTFFTNDIIRITGQATVFLATTQVFRDPSSWYHIVLAMDTTNATADNRLRLYVNGSEVTDFGTRNNLTLNTDYGINQASVAHYLMSYNTAFCDGYLAEVNFIDGQALTPSSFGFYDNNGIWQPKGYTGTYGTNGFYLKFTDVGATSGANTGYGKDFSGFNTNYWTTNNFGTTSTLTTYDSMYDSPVNASNGITGIGNYPTWNPLSSAATYADANLSVTTTNNSAPYNAETTIKTPSSGKWYAEITLSAKGAGNPVIGIGNNNPDQYAGYRTNGTYVSSVGSSTGTPATFTTNDVIGVAFDADNGNLNFYKNGTLQTGGFTGITAGNYSFILREDSASGDGAILNCGQRPFAYSNFGTDRPAATYLALNTQNLTTPTITNGAAYMAAVTYTGTGSSQTITASSTNSGNNPNGTTFQPDFVWVKGRSGATDHALYDAVRGVQLQLESNTTTAETTETTGLTAFTSSGFTTGALAQMNTNTATYVAWEWNAGGSNATNTSGSITSTVRANTSAGFSIVTYISNGVNGATIGHGLGVAPSLVIVKCRYTGTTQNWAVYHSSIGATQYLLLNSTAAAATSATYWNNTAPDSSKFTIGTNNDVNINSSVYTYVAYCFAPVAGYSAFGSYTGNGASTTDGPFTYLGFRPRFLLVKRSDSTGSWLMFDSSRDTYNPDANYLIANSSAAEAASGVPPFDFLSNGFKCRATVGAWPELNTSGATVIYAAFAENPFKISRAR